jgi:hypothetical protein
MKQDWYPDELTQHWRFPLRSANYSTVRGLKVAGISLSFVFCKSHDSPFHFK